MSRILTIPVNICSWHNDHCRLSAILFSFLISFVFIFFSCCHIDQGFEAKRFHCLFVYSLSFRVVLFSVLKVFAMALKRIIALKSKKVVVHRSGCQVATSQHKLFSPQKTFYYRPNLLS